MEVGRWKLEDGRWEQEDFKNTMISLKFEKLLIWQK